MTGVSDAWEIRLIFLKSLCILLDAASSPTYLRNVSYSHSIQNNVLKNVRFCCNFNFDAWFQGKTLLNKKRKARVIFHCIIITVGLAFISKFCFVFSIVREKVIIKFNIDLFWFHFVEYNWGKGMMKEIHKDWILRAEKQNINSFGSHCYFGVYLCWIGVIHLGPLHKTSKQDRIWNDRKTLPLWRLSILWLDTYWQNDASNFWVVQLLFGLLCAWIKNFAFTAINLEHLKSSKFTQTLNLALKALFQCSGSVRRT